MFLKNKNQNARVSRGVGAALKSMIRLLIMSTTKAYRDFTRNRRVVINKQLYSFKIAVIIKVEKR